VRERYLALKRVTLILQGHVRCFLLRKKYSLVKSSRKTNQVTPNTVPYDDRTLNTKNNTSNFDLHIKTSLHYHVPLHIHTCSPPHPTWFEPFLPTVYDSLIMEKRQAIAHGMAPLNSIYRGPGIASIRRIERVRT
jgi:hypothetical protein